MRQLLNDERHSALQIVEVKTDPLSETTVSSWPTVAKVSHKLWIVTEAVENVVICTSSHLLWVSTIRNI